MIPLLLAAAALVSPPAGLTAPIPTADPRGWLTDNDYPLLAVNQYVDGAVKFALTVSLEGRPIGCAIEVSSGSKLLDDKTCELMLQRARFRPAHDGQDNAIIGVYRKALLWSMGFTSPPALPGNLLINLKKIPSGLSDRPYVPVSLSVNDIGMVVGCVVQAPLSGSSEKYARAVEILGSAACEGAISGLKFDPAKDENGKVVASVQNAIIVFAASPSRR